MSAQDVRTFLAQKKIALDFGSGWTVSIVSKLNPDLKAAEVLNCAPMPIGKKHTTFAVMDFWGISAFTKNQDAAWSWVKYLSSKDVTIKMFKDNGVTSSRIDVAQSDIIKNDKFASVISSQIPYARTMSMYEGLGEVNDAVNVAMQEALTKQKTPEVALKDATAKINGILNRYKK
jgi:multiple sugar transport system substrate-binding protein